MKATGKAVLSPANRRQRMLESKRRYNTSAKGRSASARYAASEKGRASSARYNRSDRGARRAIAYNRTQKGRARSERFERTSHRRQYKALSYIFGTPYRDLEVTAVLAANRNQPNITEGHLFLTIPVRCSCWKCKGRRAKAPMATRRIPIHRTMAGTASGREH